MSSPMIVIALNHPQQHAFLLHLFESYTRSGELTPDQLAVAADTFVRVQNAQELPPLDKPEDTRPQNIHLGKAKLTEMGPNGVAIEFGDDELACELAMHHGREQVQPCPSCGYFPPKA